MMICLTYGKQLGIDHMVVKGFQSFPAWKSFAMKFFSGRLKHAHVALQLQSVLEDTLDREWRRPGPIYINSGSISIHSIVYFLDSIVFHMFISSGIFLTTRSSLVGWLAQFPSTATPSTEALNHLNDNVVYFIVDLVQEILFSKDCSLSWIQKSKIDPSYYHPILALKLAMLISLFELQAEDNSRLLASMLLGSENIAHLLPPKFVYCLLRTRKDRNLNLSVDAVAQAFLYVEDPLLIVSSKGKIETDDTCAIFVDFTKSKEEILNIVLAKKTMPRDYQLLENFGVEFPLPSGPIPEYLLSPASNTSSEDNPNMMNYVSESSNTTEAHQLRNYLKELGAEVSDGGGNTRDVNNKKGKGKNGKKGKRNGQTSSNNGDLHPLTMMAPELLPAYLKNIANFINENKGESLSSSSAIALINKKSEMILHGMEASIEDYKFRAKECRTKHVNLKICEVLRCDVKMSIKEEYLQLILEKLLENGLIKLDPTTQESKGGQMAVSGSSSTTEVIETQTEDLKTKKGKGKKGKKI
uniref:uncharacterized protein LOC122597537 n=1 Tax=Erigeron canadensis TaxID=72917 RepID=UPI001CB8F40E|nr:uncharacterized protein LOC122597537 [Erigeron canadensis]